MHELSVALSILDVVEVEAQRQGGARVAAIHLKLGPLSGVVKESLLAAFELAREGTAFAQSELLITEVAVVGYCPRCLTQRSVESVQMICCEVCGTPMPDIRSGRELDVTALEVCV